MEYFVAIGVAALIEALQDRKALRRVLPKVAKVFVAIERAAEVQPELTAAIERARQKA
ncbi:MAG TPA: hypothetical protein V6C97_27070 [Oculatellaceae cyanobacterium]